MLLTTPYVLAVNATPSGNFVRQIAAAGEAREGALIAFKRDKVSGWLFQPAYGADAILMVPPKTNLEKIPNNYSRIIGATIADSAAPHVNLTGAPWLRHPALGDGQARDEAQEHQRVLDSWKGTFSYVEEDIGAGVIGLRPPQVGAVHSVHAHWSVAETPATVVMPTGTGKTETMLSVLISACCPRVLVVVPTDALRAQIADKFLTLGILKLQGAAILGDGALHPSCGTFPRRSPR
jgi:hypothetical protein